MFILGPNFFHPGSASKNLNILTQKLGNMIRIVHPGSGSATLRAFFRQCGGSGMFIPDPDFYLSRIRDLGSRIPGPKTAMKDRGEKKIVVKPFFCSHKFHNIELFYF
jgi:hypothetical protein